MLAASLVMVATVISVTPTPAASHPTVEATAPHNTPETKVPPASDQKSSEESSKNEKNDKKKGPITGMLLVLFGAIAGHQGATR
jgi:hypothetical protein